MFDKLNFGDMGKMVEELQKKAAEFQSQHDAKVYTAKSGGGMIEASMNGKGEMIDLNVDDTLLQDKESLQILLMSAFTDLHKMIEADKKNSALNMMGAFNPFGSK